MNVRALLFVVAVGSMAAACGGAPTMPSSVTSTTAASGPEPQVASVWRSKCGACHVPVEPGSRNRVVIEKAMERHHKRLRLPEAQWLQLVDFLAPPESQQASAR